MEFRHLIERSDSSASVSTCCLPGTVLSLCVPLQIRTPRLELGGALKVTVRRKHIFVFYPLNSLASLIAQLVKNLPTIQETPV